MSAPLHPLAIAEAGSNYMLAILQKRYIDAAGIALRTPALDLFDITPRNDIVHVIAALDMCAVGNSTDAARAAIEQLGVPCVT